MGRRTSPLSKAQRRREWRAGGTLVVRPSLGRAGFGVPSRSQADRQQTWERPKQRHAWCPPPPVVHSSANSGRKPSNTNTSPKAEAQEALELESWPGPWLYAGQVLSLLWASVSHLYDGDDNQSICLRGLWWIPDTQWVHSNRSYCYSLESIKYDKPAITQISQGLPPVPSPVSAINSFQLWLLTVSWTQVPRASSLNPSFKARSWVRDPDVYPHPNWPVLQPSLRQNHPVGVAQWQEQG